MMQNFIAFSFMDLALVHFIPAGGCKFCNTKIMSTYQGDVEKSSLTYISASAQSYGPSRKFSYREPQWEFIIILANPCPIINFVGLISMSYSRSTAIHLALLPFRSGYVSILFTTLLGTYEAIWEWRM